MVAAGSVSQRLAGKTPFSYRADPNVPPFPDDRALLVFDGVCVLCSATARFVLRQDQARRFRFATAQSQLGQALFRHYGLDPETFETNLVLVDGRAYGKLDTVVAAGRLLGGVWRMLSLLRVLPRPMGDWLYDRVARNRYRLFGRTEHCMIPPPRWRDRFVDL
jgi:predicted DCC family thiol-disulfide oxidoreductase YuxK